MKNPKLDLMFMQAIKTQLSYSEGNSSSHTMNVNKFLTKKIYVTQSSSENKNPLQADIIARSVAGWGK